MNPHFIAVPSFGAFTTWRLPCGNLQGLGREADRTTDPKVLALRTVDELGAYLLEGSDLAGSEAKESNIKVEAVRTWQKQSIRGQAKHT